MSGSGNDFILIDNRFGAITHEEIAPFIQKVCARGLSVGADGLILIETSKKADFAWRYYNADGGEAEMCGNGSRCAARFAHLNGIVSKPEMRFETLAGIIEAEVKGDRARVKLTDPSDLRLDLKVQLAGKEYVGHFLNTGVPHLVIPVDDVEKTDVMTLGRSGRNHALFAPKGTNVNFASIGGRESEIKSGTPSSPSPGTRLPAPIVYIRTYERGVEGETLACGTGAVATALVLGALGRSRSPVSLMTRGGILLTVDYSWDGKVFSNVHLEGDAKVVFVGEMWDEAWK
jgi:diaminopimelate epimerase